MKKFIFLFIFFLLNQSVTIASVTEEPLHAQQGFLQKNFVLIFNSHNYIWGGESALLAKEIQKYIEKADTNIFTRITHADIGSRPSFRAERLSMQEAFAKGRATKKMVIPSALIFIGEEAWMFYQIMNLRSRWDTIPVIICGTRPMILDSYDSFYEKNRFNASNMIPVTESSKNLPFTGIYKSNNIFQTIDLIKTLMPDTKNLTFVSNDKYSDELTLFYLKNNWDTLFPEASLNVIHEKAFNKDSIHYALNNLPQKSAVLVQMFQPKQANAPVFTLIEQNFDNDFIVGGYYPRKKDYAIKTAELLMKIRQGEPPNNIPFEYLKKDKYYLNQTALLRFKLLNKAKKLDDVVFTNIPPSFLIRYVRIITFIVITIIVFAAVAVAYYFARLYRQNLLKSHNKYKKLYELFQIIYDNIPVGLVHFDSKGNLIDRNPESDLFFNLVAPENKKTFNLFESDLFSNQQKIDIANNDEVNTSLDLKGYSLHIVLKKIPGEESDNDTILAVIIDKTDLEREKKETNLLSSVFDFTVDVSGLGVAEYNCITKTGYASKTWHKNFRIQKETPFNEILSNVRSEDVAKIQLFLNDIIQKKVKTFDQNIAIKNGNELHWLRCIFQLKNYAPEQNIIQVIGLCFNVDEQIAREQELISLTQKAKESERLKNEFVANSKSDIRLPLDDIIKYSRKIIHSRNRREKEQFNKILNQNNTILLQLIHETIEKAKRKSEKFEE